MPKGTLYLYPMTLGSEGDINDVIPSNLFELVKEFRFFAVENVKTTRRYLRKIDRTFPIDDCTFFTLNKKTSALELPEILKPLKEGHNLAIISEAGCAGVADPGASLVSLAHKNKIEIRPLVGPSSILLGLMGSGFNGQTFAFHGYVPKERKKRIAAFKKFESVARQTGQTQIFMETPFRNNNLIEDLLNELLDETPLSIASDLTLPTQKIRTMQVAEWRKNAYDLNKKPAIFLIGNMM